MGRVVLPTKRLSYTQIDTYLNCPRKYNYIYVEKPERLPGSVAMILGKSVHEVLARILARKMDGRKYDRQVIHKLIKESRVKLRKELSDIAKLIGLPININEASRQHDALIEKWCLDILPEFEPTAVEAKVEAEIAGYPFIMYIDAIHADKRVVDWKVTTSMKNKYQVAGSLQLSIYCMGTGMREVAFGSLIRPREGKEANWKPRIEVVKGTRNMGELRWAEEVIGGAIEGIANSYYPVCGTDNFLCSAKYCDFWPICRGQTSDDQPEWLKDIVGEW
jgi:CRISPR/Cas system-associated exonuclease Cas4 (RecB family)